MIDTSLKCGFFVAQAAARHLVERGGFGRIINIGSQAGTVGIEERSAYSASKGGIALSTKVLAIELAPHDIIANTVAPTYLATKLTRSTLEDPARYERVLSRIPLGCVAEIEDVAAAMVYLAGRPYGHRPYPAGRWGMDGPVMEES